MTVVRRDTIGKGRSDHEFVAFLGSQCDLLGGDVVGGERHVTAVLLDTSYRQENNPIAQCIARLGPAELAETGHGPERSRMRSRLGAGS